MIEDLPLLVKNNTIQFALKRIDDFIRKCCNFMSLPVAINKLQEKFESNMKQKNVKETYLTYNKLKVELKTLQLSASECQHFFCNLKLDKEKMLQLDKKLELEVSKLKVLIEKPEMNYINEVDSYIGSIKAGLQNGESILSLRSKIDHALKEYDESFY